MHCIECHLPPAGHGKLWQKTRTGIRDIYGALFKDVENINWEQKSSLEFASHHTFEESCIKCHENYFPIGLSTDGEDAHLYYVDNSDELHCINCHLSTGHFSENVHAQNVDFGKDILPDTIYSEPAKITSFEDYTEYIPGTAVSFEMKAIPGGSFLIGSPDSEAGRDPDEGPQVRVEVSPFFMAEVEVSWNEYLAFFTETASEGRTTHNAMEEVDAISGPTPPWGDPSQGWGKGDRPAITMSHFAARVYCRWLSQKTGKKYRLPTEAEWEYAARGGTEGPYFFEGNSKDYTSEGFLKKIFGTDTSVINSYAVYRENSRGMSSQPGEVKPNAFGLKHMTGNVSEFCQDYYKPDIYSLYPEGVKDPKGPETGEEYVIRGGSFNADAGDLRMASRDFTRTAAWLKTDPQMPKSVWWYSDAIHVGFRVVCEFESAK